FQAELRYVLSHFDPASGKVRSLDRTNPESLAREIWQTVWRLKADAPEDCLATFVELFVYKFLDDLGLMRRAGDGSDISLQYLLQLLKDRCYSYYTTHAREEIKRLFPPGADGYSVINGIVLQDSNVDHNIIFHELLQKFARFGSLRNTDSDFKRRLYESFLQESRTTQMFGQFLTPRVIVSAIYDMANVRDLPSGQNICDPASGVGGFVLEEMARDLQDQWTARANTIRPVHSWHAWEVVPKTSILAKANALVHCGDFLAEYPARVKSFASWLNKVFRCYDRSGLGSLEEMPSKKFDLVMTNPPFVVSGSRDFSRLVQRTNRRRKYYEVKSSGVEGLFVQLVVKGLKANGHAWILLPETFFLRSTDRQLRTWIYDNCKVDLLAILPEKAFYNTSKRVVIAHLQRRPRPLRGAAQRRVLESESTLLYAVGEIGETRDVRRLPTESHLPSLVASFREHQAGRDEFDDSRAVAVASSELADRDTLNLRLFWALDVARELELLPTLVDPAQQVASISRTVDALRDVISKWEQFAETVVEPSPPRATRKVALGDTTLFGVRIGRRVLKKDIYKNRTGTPLYSANVRKPFGFVAAPNAGGLAHGGFRWSIDSDWDVVPVAAGERYSITDHCGQLEIRVEGINHRYLARQVLAAGAEQGFNREYRPSLAQMRALEVELPMLEDGGFDESSMNLWASYWEQLERQEHELAEILAVQQGEVSGEAGGV
ncbi:MAG: N-6 DNA methylase, partial [Planctomycetes bacterium]|nr:N-6 DNA methylase [Planctomycetota bacterium]